MTIRLRAHIIGLATVALLAAPGSAAAVVPGSNGAIVVSKCEDGTGDCKVSHIWTVDPASGAEQPITTDPSYWDDDPAVSPDGTRVAFQRCPAAGTCRIAVVGIGGGTVTDLTAGTDYEDYPAWSPDGGKLVFSRHAAAGGEHLVVMDVAGGNEHPLTGGAGTDRQATWSPDGSTIAFSRTVPGAGTQIRAVPAGGGRSVALTAGTLDYAPSFSPDGARIAFSSDWAIHVMDAGGANEHALTAPPVNRQDNEPAFSPDGTQIVYERYSQELPHATPLYVMGADGSGQRLITAPSGFYIRADWQATHPAPAASTAAARQPVLTLAAPARQSVRKRALRVFATSDEHATAVATGKVTIVPSSPNATGRGPIRKRLRLRPKTATLAANARTEIRLALRREPLRAVRAALARGGKVRARIAVRAQDAAGNATTRTLTFRVK